jgi:hypothetical protein
MTQQVVVAFFLRKVTMKYRDSLIISSPKAFQTHGIPKDIMRRSRTTRHTTRGEAANGPFSPAVLDEFTPFQPNSG